jgi:hypothetical protein
MKTVPAIACSLAVGVSSAFAGYGDKVNGLPNWQERAILVLTNACRMAPTQYRDKYLGATYNILLPANYPAVPPVYWNLALNGSARFHAIQMADTCGMTHNSCNGDAFSTRIQLFYNNKSYTIGEDIAAGNTNPSATMTQWLLDEQNGTVPLDNTTCGTSRCDGHRWNIMSKSYREMGTGYAYGPQTYNYFWCQDLGGGAPEFGNPIVSAAHLFIETGKTTFLADYFDAAGKPSNPSLYVDNQKSSMTLLMGADSAGTYSVSLAKTTSCRNYYFTFTNAKGTLFRYPETGDLVTFGEGSCVRDFVPAESLSVGGMVPGNTAHNHGLTSRIDGACLVVTVAGAISAPVSTSIFDCAGRQLYSIVWAPGAFAAASQGRVIARNPIPGLLSPNMVLVKHCLASKQIVVETAVFLPR